LATHLGDWLAAGEVTVYGGGEAVAEGCERLAADCCRLMLKVLLLLRVLRLLAVAAEAIAVSRRIR